MSARRPPDDELLSPKHWILTHYHGDNPEARLRNKNPAAYLILHRQLDQSWDAWLGAMIEQGATDEDIFAGDWLDLIPSWPVRRYIPERLAELRGQPSIDPRTPLARRTIPKIAKGYHESLQRTGKPQSKKVAAELAQIDRGTLDDWIKRGWMTWPPAPPAGS